MISKSKAKSIDKLISFIEKYREREVKRILKKNKDVQKSAVLDRIDCLLSLAKDAVSLADLKSDISYLFSDKDDTDKVILSSTHKAKGLETDNVYILWDTYFASEKQEELNLKYVAITRSKKNLYFVTKSKEMLTDD